MSFPMSHGGSRKRRGSRSRRHRGGNNLLGQVASQLKIGGRRRHRGGSGGNPLASLLGNVGAGSAAPPAMGPAMPPAMGPAMPAAQTGGRRSRRKSRRSRSSRKRRTQRRK